MSSTFVWALFRSLAGSSARAFSLPTVNICPKNAQTSARARERGREKTHTPTSSTRTQTHTHTHTHTDTLRARKRTTRQNRIGKYLAFFVAVVYIYTHLHLYFIYFKFVVVVVFIFLSIICIIYSYSYIFLILFCHTRLFVIENIFFQYIYSHSHLTIAQASRQPCISAYRVEGDNVIIELIASNTAATTVANGA